MHLLWKPFKKLTSTPVVYGIPHNIPRSETNLVQAMLIAHALTQNSVSNVGKIIKQLQSNSMKCCRHYIGGCRWRGHTGCYGGYTLSSSPSVAERNALGQNCLISQFNCNIKCCTTSLLCCSHFLLMLLQDSHIIHLVPGYKQNTQFQVSDSFGCFMQK